MKDREIKFRAWLHHPEEMVTNFWVNGNTIIYDDGKGFMQKQVDNEISIMQFTGIKDKNGKEIYEGDILRAEGQNHKYIQVVEFHNTQETCGRGWIGRNIFREASVHFQTPKTRIDDAFSYFDMPHGEIIGNIYENPELLK